MRNASHTTCREMFPGPQALTPAWKLEGVRNSERIENHVTLRLIAALRQENKFLSCVISLSALSCSLGTRNNRMHSLRCAVCWLAGWSIAWWWWWWWWSNVAIFYHDCTLRPCDNVGLLRMQNLGGLPTPFKDSLFHSAYSQ